MAIVISKLRALRLEYRRKRNGAVTLQEVAESTGILRKRLTNLELGQFDRITTEELEKLRAYYSERLGRPIDIGDLLGFESTNNTKALEAALV